jgi:polar amino acid transport system ATP-binding protein
MLLATHEMGFARDVASKVAFLYKGQVEEEGRAADIFSDPQRETTRSFLRSVIEAKRM